MNIEILLIHEDFVTTTTTVSTLMLLNGLLVLVEPNFLKPKEMSKEEPNVFRKSFCTSERNRDGTLSVYKSSSMKSIREPPSIVSFSDPGFTEANKALEHLQKSSEKQATLPAYRARKKRSETNFQ